MPEPKEHAVETFHFFFGFMELEHMELSNITSHPFVFDGAQIQRSQLTSSLDGGV